MTQWERFTDTFFKWDVMVQYLPAIGRGFVVTCELAVLVVICGISLGLILALIRSYQIKIINYSIICLVDILRSLPPLVLIILFYFGLPNVGLNFSGFMVVILVLSFVLGSFAEEIFWAGITSIHKGQWEASRSTGLGYSQTLIYVILPQAIRMTIPPLTNRTIAITKNTALGMVVGVGEILNQATIAQSFSSNASPLMMGAIAYVLLFVPIVYLGRRIETRFAWKKN
jgi:polar amino acid transport system permease protein